MRLEERLLLALVPRLGRWATVLLTRTLRVEVVDEQYAGALWARRNPIIYAIWHGRILILPVLYGKSRRVSVMASRHRDGELVTRFVRGFGFEVVRGSTTRGGSEALRRLARLLRDGAEVAVVPDGPRGPSEVAQPGVIALARLTGAPIVPVSVGASRAWRLRSWDTFLIPKPFARVAVCFGVPLFVPPGTDRVGQEALRKELEESLREITWRADARARAS
jgi:lysophospholipid acyltransferase (LPLAT)-like uncharacterized protein